jgi:hypothetical protein
MVTKKGISYHTGYITFPNAAQMRSNWPIECAEKVPLINIRKLYYMPQVH